LETQRGILTRLTVDLLSDVFPVWSPDSSRIAFSSNRKGAFELYQKPASGPGTETLLFSPNAGNKVPMDWSADGRFLLYRITDVKTGFDLFALPLDGDRKQPIPIAQTNFEENDGQFSPDGKWAAYQSNESGHMEIYVQAFPNPGEKPQISTMGGTQPRWRQDGRELFYIGLDGRLMAVPIQWPRNGAAVEPGTPIPLFTTNIGGALQGVMRQQYVAAPDGQRFLMNTLTEDTATTPITLILNWQPKH
jgi:Tol biopolymer transport system component